MVNRRRIVRRKDFRGVGALAVGAVGSSVIGSALPGTAGVPLTRVGSTFAGFVPVAAAVTGAGIVMRNLKHLEPKRKRRRK